MWEIAYDLSRHTRKCPLKAECPCSERVLPVTTQTLFNGLFQDMQEIKTDPDQILT